MDICKLPNLCLANACPSAGCRGYGGRGQGDFSPPATEQQIDHQEYRVKGVVVVD